MLTNPTIEKLQDLRLSGMQSAYHEQRESSQYESLTFDERFGLIVDRETATGSASTTTASSPDPPAPAKPTSPVRWDTKPAGKDSPSNTAASPGSSRIWPSPKATDATPSSSPHWPKPTSSSWTIGQRRS